MRAKLVHAACGKVAFYKDSFPFAGEYISSEGIIYVDGTPAKPSDDIHCSSCGVRLSLLEINLNNWTPNTD